jgi:hypothetical protein
MTPAFDAIEGAAPAIVMIAMFACVIGGVWMIVKRGDRKKGALMLVMAAVLLGNVLIWTI